MLARQASVNSTGETFLDRMPSEACFKVREARSSGASAKERRAAAAALRPAAIQSRRVGDSMRCFTASGMGVSIEVVRYTIASSSTSAEAKAAAKARATPIGTSYETISHFFF